MQTDMISYYGRRAREYEQVYAKEERQEDLAQVRKIVGAAFDGQDVLEVACGTACWTEAFADSARSVMACDINSEVLEIARGKDWGTNFIEFFEADAYALPEFDRQFSAAFSGFWWSHIPRSWLSSFLDRLHKNLRSGSKVVFIDNRFIEGSSTPIFRIDEFGDSFQQRILADGSVHEVLKNFPSESELLSAVSESASAADVLLTDYFWILSYQIE
jgi:SAM-dependent methyltransferase